MDTQSPEIDKLADAIVTAQQAMTPALKDHVNPFFKSKYADLGSVWQALAPFREAGIAITQSPMDSPDGYIVLDTQLTHTSGQWMRARLKMRVSKDDPQGAGSALTYARRYSLGCVTGLVTEEDDDGNLASQLCGPTHDQKFAQAPLKPAPAKPPAPAKVVAPAPVVAQESAFIWQIGKTHGGKCIEDMPLDYLQWYVANGKKRDHLDACCAELIRVDTEAGRLPVAVPPPVSTAGAAYIEQIGLCETVSECIGATAQALNDTSLSVFEQAEIEAAEKKRLVVLRG